MKYVRFAEDFAPFGKRAGEYRAVSDAVAIKLRDTYGVVNEILDYPLSVRVRVSLKKRMGPQWYPQSEHLVDPSIVSEMIDDGSLEIIGVGVSRGGSRQTDNETHGGQVVFRSKYLDKPLTHKYVVDHDFYMGEHLYRVGVDFCNWIVDFAEMVQKGYLHEVDR